MTIPTASEKESNSLWNAEALESLSLRAQRSLRQQDPELHQLLLEEWERQQTTIPLNAAENWCSLPAMALLGSVLTSTTCEGFPGRRFHSGAEVIDRIERIACERACDVFGAVYANVQPHSASQANQIALMALCPPGGRVMGLGLDTGGHLSHGAPPNWSAHVFESHPYSHLTDDGLLDYDAIAEQARQIRPQVLICGASSYPRQLDFARFRAIADEVGACLLADISHIAGLVVAGEHPSPIPHAHVVTTSTYKPGGPRGGLILVGDDFVPFGQQRSLSALLSRWTFPGVQGTAAFNSIAAKATLFLEMQGEKYQQMQEQIRINARALAAGLQGLGYKLVTGGTDNHMVLLELQQEGVTGHLAQVWLETCGILSNKNKIPSDPRNAFQTSGLRLGTSMVTGLGMKEAQMTLLVQWIDSVLQQVQIHRRPPGIENSAFVNALRREVRQLRLHFPGANALSPS